jgi:hypothetical protein
LVLLTALAFASSSKAAVESPPPPSVWSDKADYAPGELVTLSGANWAPGEAVHIRVNDDAGQTWSRDVDVTAADDGTISDQFNLPSSFVAVYSVTVTGASSGTATWSFTDGDIRVRAGRSPGNANTAVTIAAGNLKLFSTSDCSGTSTSSNASPFTTGGGSGNGYANPTPALNAASGTSFSVQVPSSVTVGTTTYSFASWQSDGTNATLVATSGTTGCFLSNANGQISLTANYADTVNTTTTASNASATYGDTSVTLAATVSPASGPAVNTGTVTFTVNGTPVTSGTVSGGNASATFSLSGVNAGSYNIAATYNAGSGFNASNNSTQSPAPKLILAKADPVCAISGYDDVYDGQAHGASGSCTGVEDEVLAGLDLGDTFTNVPGGTAEWAFTDVTGNYNDDSGSVEIVIDKADADCSSIAGYSVTYDASAHTATGTCEGVGTDGTLAGLDLSGTTHTNAGDYSGDPWNFTDTSGNYNDTSGTVDDFIDKADADCSSIGGYDDVYDGQAHGASGSCTGVEDEVLAGLDLGDTFTNVPGGTAEWAFTDVTGNYNDDSGSVEIVISKAELTVKADNKAKDYDGSAFTGFTRTITGFASGEGESVITGSVTYGGTAVGAVNAGTYTIVPDVSGLSADNYTFAPSNGTLTINKVTLTVRADDKSKVFDGSPFTAFTRTITGFVNSEDESVISGSVTYAGDAVGATAVGTYTITPVVSGLSATNYNFTPANGTLTIGAWNAAGYGFYQPVGADAAHSIFTAAPASAPTGKPASMEWNTAKGGSTIPLKFNVYAGLVEKTSLTDTFAATPFRTVKLPACTDATSEDLVDFTTTGNTTLRYDGTAGQWIQNWKTPTDNKESCYRAWVTFADGSSIEAFFKLKK